MVVKVEVNTPLSQALNDAVQPKLVEAGWSSADDATLAEYIVLMLVNGKTQEEIASDLSKDLLQLAPEDTGAVEFSKWLFEQVEVLHQRLSGPQLPSSTHGASSLQAIPSFPGVDDRRRVNGLDGAVASEDMDIDEGMNGNQEVPTGPRAMRNLKKNSTKRMFGQISKAMDRTNDSVLHRVRPQQGSINMHNREPPRGPRSMQGRVQKMVSGRPFPGMGMPPGPMPHAGMGFNPQGPVPPLALSPQQQMQLFAMYEEQARMMSQMLSPQQQQVLMSGVPQPAINPAFQNASPQRQTGQGRSLFERVENHPRKHNNNNHFNKHPQQSGQHIASDTVMSDSKPDSSKTDSMDVESTTTSDPAETVCRFNLSCTKKDCPYAHQSPAAPQGTAIDMKDVCSFGAACKNRKCVGRHPSPAQKTSYQSEQDCRFFPNCTNPNCPFRHPTMPMCRNGADCTLPGCKFTHVKIQCKFNPCLNPNCPYKHAEGQKRGGFEDKVWTAGEAEREHISERKFVQDENAEEQLIKPKDSTDEDKHQQNGVEATRVVSSPQPTEIVT